MSYPRMKWTKNLLPKTEDKYTKDVNNVELLKALKYHKSFPQYSETPLVSLKNLSKFLNVKNIYVKDESYRFGLNAFKVTGASYAIGKYIAKSINEDISNLPYEKLISKKVLDHINGITFYAATDGNHGRATAWAANNLKQKCIIHMPKGTTPMRLKNIQKLGAIADITEFNYDDCVRLANKEANENKNGVIVQDTAWKDYYDIPTWIMQGYGTLFIEIEKQIAKLNGKTPTHVFVQAGVGSLAGAAVGYFTNMYKENKPKMIIVEAEAANCLYRSAKEGSGSLSHVKGDINTIMAGLACGEANIIAWDILKNHADVFVSAPDYISSNGSRIYGNPLDNDTRVISGESGSVTMGVLFSCLTDNYYSDLKEYLKLDENSEILLISTEGNTEPDRYREIVWNGLFSDPSIIQ